MALSRRARVRILLAVVLALLLVAAGAVAAVSWQSADKLVHPARDLPQADPAGRGLAYENVTLTTADGLDLSAWWIPANASARGTVIFLHGYGDNKEQALFVAPFLHEAGWNVLAFDFRAHGLSEGDETTVGLVETADVRAAYEVAAARADPARVALFGWSMGAATAINAGAEVPEARAIVADSAFATLENIASNSITHFTDLPKYPFGPLAVVFAGWMVGRDVGDNRPIDLVGDLGRPVLVIQGADDTIVYPEDDGAALAARAPPGSAYWLVEGAGHVGAHEAAPEEYRARVLAFLDAGMG